METAAEHLRKAESSLISSLFAWQPGAEARASGHLIKYFSFFSNRVVSVAPV